MKTNYIIFTFALLVCSTVSFNTYSQDISVLFREAQRFEENRKEQEALKKYQEIVRIQPEHLAALCKISELESLAGSREPEKQMKMKYYRAARHTAEAALKINPNYSEANFVMAMAMGRMALILSGQDKINAVNDIKKYAEISIRNDPANYKSYHVLGKWHFEVSSLNAFEKMGVKLLFGGFPASSFEESIRCYEKSRAINPGFTLNYLEGARVYHKNNQDNKAIELLKKLQTVPIKMPDDTRIKMEGTEMLRQLQN